MLTGQTARRPTAYRPAGPAARDGARIVAIGDSLTAGILDVWTNTRVLPWPVLLARLLGAAAVTNLARTGAGIAGISREQLPVCRAGPGDLVGMWVGANDIFGRRFDDRGLVGAVEGLAAQLAGGGGVLLTMELPPVSQVLPVPRGVLGRFDERCALLNDTMAGLGRRFDTVHLPWADGPGLRGPDGVHLTQRGHAAYALRYARVVHERTGGPAADEARRAVPADLASRFPDLELSGTSPWSRRRWYLTSAPRWGVRRWLEHQLGQPALGPIASVGSVASVRSVGSASR